MARWLATVCALLGLCTAIYCEESKYDNYTLMKIIPHTKQHLEKLIRLRQDPKGIEILKWSRGVNHTTDVLVAPHMRWLMDEYVSKHKMPVVEYKYNYGRNFESIPKKSTRAGFNLYGYNSYDDMTSFIRDLAKREKKHVTIEYMGESYEKRKINLVKISTNPGRLNPIIFIDAGIHAREWLAPAMAMYLIQRLAKDSKARKNELNGVDWYILPMVNPDGYEFSRSGKNNRLWRKTRSKHDLTSSFGVDGNRNYDFEWGGLGASSNPSQDNYRGPRPFSEPETQIVAKIMQNYRNRIKLYVSLHSYGAYLVYPWGFTREVLPEKWRRLDNLAQMVSDSLVKQGGRSFEIMSAGEWYPASGGSDDYAYGAMDIPYVYTMELSKGFEFVFPEQLLKTVLPRYYQAFVTFSVQIKREFGKK